MPKQCLFALLFLSVSLASDFHFPLLNFVPLPHTASICGEQQTCGQPSQPCYLGEFSCVGGYYCDFSTRTCLQLLENGESCSDYTQCKSRNCVLNVCRDEVYSGIGQKCNNDQRCLSIQGLCDNFGICQRKPALGEKCFRYNDCAGGTFCDSATNLCTASFSREVGEFCVFSPDCVPGLYCNYTTSQCLEVDKGTHLPCDPYGDDCPVNQYCDCEGFGNQYTPECLSFSESRYYTPQYAATTLAAQACFLNSGDQCLSWTENGNVKICDLCKNQWCSLYNATMSIPYIKVMLDFYPTDCWSLNVQQSYAFCGL